MAGNIEKRGNKAWRVTVVVGRDERGEPVRHRKLIHGTKKDAQTYLTGVLREVDLGRYVSPEERNETELMSLNTFLDKWLEVRKTNVAQKTFAEYEGNLDRHVRPHLGKIPVGRLTTIEIQTFYAKLARHVSRTVKGTPRPMGPAGIRKVHAVLRAALETAVEWRIRTDNPARYAKPPKLAQVERPAITSEMGRAFVEAAKTAPRGIVYLVGVLGLRPNEYLGLQWSDLEWDTRRLTIKRVLNRSKGGGWIFEDTKTKKSRRTIVLPDELIPLLREHRARQLEKRMLAGNRWQDHRLIFCTDLGQPLHQVDIAARDFKRIVAASNEAITKAAQDKQKAALAAASTRAERRDLNQHYEARLREALLPDNIRPYDLRHACATILIEQGEDLKIVADQLGHSTIRLTADTYGHTTEGMKRRAAIKINSALFSTAAQREGEGSL